MTAWAGDVRFPAFAPLGRAVRRLEAARKPKYHCPSRMRRDVFSRPPLTVCGEGFS